MTHAKDWYLQELSSSETNKLHRPPAEEYEFYKAVRDGDIEYIKKNISSGDFTNPDGMGVLSKNKLRNIRYHFVVTVSMITRYCIDGGLEAERAYRLSDYYILKMEDCQTLEEIANLHQLMALDFAGKMRLLLKKDVLSKPVAQCIDYIYAHINDRISIATLAEYTSLSPSYLSRIFKQNMGISLSEYIRQKKIEKAEHLLRYSDLSLVKIANTLSFSSQSHFIQTFEQFVGMTPKKYRDNYYKKMM